jgi:hypothetical protein
MVLGACVAVFLLLGELRTWLLATMVAAATTVVTGWIGSAFAKAQKAIQATAGQQPITVTVLNGPSSFEWMIPVAPADLPEAEHDLDGWALDHGGIVASPCQLVILIEGRSHQAVVLRGIRVADLSRRPPREAVCAAIIGLMRGIMIPRHFELDLDEHAPALRPAHHPWQVEATRPFPYSVSQGDPELFKVYASASRADCTWRLEIDWTVDGADGTYLLDDGGTPFHIACTAGRERYVFNLNRPEAGWTLR